jgi:ATP:cob(I)alamin adenosyltransferase
MNKFRTDDKPEPDKVQTPVQVITPTTRENFTEKISKGDKLLSVIGSIEELSTFIGILKAENFNPTSERKFDTSNSSKLFFFAHLTQIQETLCDIITSISTKKSQAKYNSTRFLGEQKIKDLQTEIDTMKQYRASVGLTYNVKNTIVISGTTVLEAQLLHARSICRRAERQSSNYSGSDETVISYFNILSDYFLSLAMHTLHLQNKEPMKRTGVR